MSDMHGQLPVPENVPESDLILIAGDICCHGKARKQLHWLDTKFRSWLNKLSVPVFACAGNHDWPFYEIPDKALALNLPWTYLEDSGAEFQELNIWGTPWQRKFFDWAFNLEDDAELWQKWLLIPDNTDILVCHSPPYGYGDMTLRGEACGSISLLRRIEDVKPKLVVYGHIHSGYGNWNYDGVRLANVSCVNENYIISYPPFEYEL